MIIPLVATHPKTEEDDGAEDSKHCVLPLQVMYADDQRIGLLLMIEGLDFGLLMIRGLDYCLLMISGLDHYLPMICLR